MDGASDTSIYVVERCPDALQLLVIAHGTGLIGPEGAFSVNKNVCSRAGQASSACRHAMATE